MIHPSTIECIKKLYEAGHTLVIASGRYFNIMNHIDVIKPYISYYVLLNGSQILHNGKEIYKDVMEVKDIEYISNELEKANISFAYVSDEDNKINRHDQELIDSYELFGLNKAQVDRQYYLKKDIYEMWCFGENKKVMDFSEGIKNYRFVTWGNLGFDILKEENSKARTLKILFEKLNIDRENTIAIGDNDNDIEMIQLVGFGIAMGNGSKKLKEIADYVTDDIDKDGLANAFKHLKLI